MDMAAFQNCTVLYEIGCFDGLVNRRLLFGGPLFTQHQCKCKCGECNLKPAGSVAQVNQQEDQIQRKRTAWGTARGEDE
jgi:hypothetical protein